VPAAAPCGRRRVLPLLRLTLAETRPAWRRDRQPVIPFRRLAGVSSAGLARGRRALPLLCLAAEGQHTGAGFTGRALGSSADRRLIAWILPMSTTRTESSWPALLAQLLDASRWKRAAGILIQRRLLPIERHRCRRRSGARYH
jgi:hypothetical protein